MKRRRRYWPACLYLALLIAASGAFGNAHSSQPDPASKQDTAASGSQAQNPDYVGAEVCKTCHEELYNNWEKTPHWKTTLDTKGGPPHQGCEGCHGPGAAHVAGGGDKAKIFIFSEHNTKQIDDRCLTCHASSKEHLKATNSLHRQNDVSCISCHSPHHAQTGDFLLAKAQPELCYTCHLQQKSQFAMPFHHRVDEGLVQCTDCHNPHGTELAKQVRMSSTQDAVCFKCHVDKHGPFVFEHPAVKIEGCSSCHVTHGSPNSHLLKFSSVNMLCLQCHTTSSFSGAPGTPSFHNQATQFQACTLCHVQIHGSNFDPFYFK